MEDHSLKRLLEEGLCATVNSDDPAYFGGYMNENFLAAQQGLGLSRDEVVQLVRNSFEATFLDRARKDTLLKELDDYVATAG